MARRLLMSLGFVGPFLLIAGASAQKGGSPAANNQVVQPPKAAPSPVVVVPKAGAIVNPTLVKSPRDAQPAYTTLPISAGKIVDSKLPAVAVPPLDPALMPKRHQALGPKKDSRIRGPNLSQTPDPSSQPVVAASGDDVYVAWSEGTGNNSQEILLAMSRDGGASFWPAFNLSGTPTMSHRPQIVANAQGIHVVWIENLPAGPQLYVSTSRDRGETFSTPRAAGTVPMADPNFGIAVDGVDAYAAFVGNQVVEVVNLTTNSMKEIARGYPFRRTAIATRGKDIAVAWESNILGDWDTNLALSRDSGMTFRDNTSPNAQGKPLSRLSNYGDEWNAKLAFNDAGEIAAVYENNRQLGHAAIHLSWPIDGMLQNSFSIYLWNSAIPETTRYPSYTDPMFLREMQPQIATSGKVFVGAAVQSLTVANGTSRSEIVVWKTGLPTGTGGMRSVIGDGRFVRVSATPETQLVTWVSGDGAGEIVATRMTNDFNTPWSYFTLSSNPGRSSGPETVAARSNYVVVWTDTSQGKGDIFFRTVPIR